MSSIKINSSNGHIEVDLDRAANMFGGDKGKDFYIPIRKNKSKEAQDIIDRLLAQSRAGFEPSDSDIRAIYDMIDPSP
ncbi:MAG: hypothetical protein IT372_39550 [Polyangiaceae bacterium]|nr:hypothetical protein [Polyangiaceae bacterium]